MEYELDLAQERPATFDPSEHKFGNCQCLMSANSQIEVGLSKGLSKAIETTDFLSSDAALLQNKLRTWENIYQCAAIVHFPYEMSTMSIFEQYTAGVPLLMPSKRLLQQLIKDRHVPPGNNFAASCLP